MDYSNRGILQQLFVDSLCDYALVILDVDGKVLSWNAGAHAMLGYSESEVVGRHFSCLYTQRDIDSGKPLMSLGGALAQGRHEETSQRLHKDGTELQTYGVLIPLYDPQKKLVAFGNLTREIGASTHVSAAQATPAVQATPAAQATPAVAVEKTSKVLLVDDDPAVRQAAAGMLAGQGYEVIMASGGIEALEMLERVDDIDVLFTDVVMPGGMDGGQVAAKAHALRPGLKVLFASGYFEPALVREGNIAASTHFLVKPYRKKDLVAKLAEVLNSKVPPT